MPKYDRHCTKAQYTMLTLSILAVISLVMLLFVTFKYIRAYCTSNKWMLLFFVNLNVTMIFRVVFFISAYFAFRHNWQPISPCLFGFVAYFGDLSFATAVIVSMFNWLHFIMVINQYTSIIKSKLNYKKLVILWWCTMFPVCAAFIGNYIGAWMTKRDKFTPIDKIERSVRAVIFLTLSVMFWTVGYKLERKLNKILIDKQAKMRLRIIAMTILVSFPLLSRGLFNVFFVIFDLRHILIIDSVEQDNYRFPVYMLTYYILADLLPMGAQIISTKIAIFFFENNNAPDLTHSNSTDVLIHNYDYSDRNLSAISKSSLIRPTFPFLKTKSDNSLLGYVYKNGEIQSE